MRDRTLVILLRLAVIRHRSTVRFVAYMLLLRLLVWLHLHAIVIYNNNNNKCNQLAYDRLLKRKVSEVRQNLSKCTCCVPPKVLEKIQVFASPSIIAHRHRCEFAVVPGKAADGGEVAPRLAYAMWDAKKRCGNEIIFVLK